MQLRRVLAQDGTLYLHLDYREAHYVKLVLDEVFGRECFLNELVWAYDYGARTRRRWPAKHDTILVYVRDPERYHFDAEEVDREPYMAPGLVTPEKAARGKLPTDVWWHTIVPTAGREKTGYPTQKPEGIVRRMVLASTRPGDWCLDPFAGSGTLGAVARSTGRRYVLMDESPHAVAVMRERLGEARRLDRPLRRRQVAQRLAVVLGVRPQPDRHLVRAAGQRDQAQPLLRAPEQVVRVVVVGREVDGHGDLPLGVRVAARAQVGDAERLADRALVRGEVAGLLQERDGAQPLPRREVRAPLGVQLVDAGVGRVLHHLMLPRLVATPTRPRGQGMSERTSTAPRTRSAGDSDARMRFLTSRASVRAAIAASCAPSSGP